MSLNLGKIKTVLALIFVLLYSFTKSQSCNPTTFPTDIYYPNSTNTPTNVMGYEYLCGPNTIVYDTINSGCHFIYVNTGSTLIFKYGSCATVGYVWLKSGSTLTILQGTTPFQIFYESGAIINNSFSVAVSSNSCASISFPAVNCTSTGLSKTILSNNGFEIYPNPVNEKLSIQFKFAEKENTKAQIINSIGQIVKEFDLENNTTTLNINELQNGFYILNIKGSNSLRASKRFVIKK